ncbi:MAG: hypothetical protein B6I26_05845 [Desulfobacteraceae bacterium 4572_130]|nr:MAG: hypothetical protein B6I26_05845 [Desulfobacteraceae bacterium 4572_130]
MNKDNLKSKGFTLVEILLAVAIFGILMITLFFSFDSFITSGNAIKNEILEIERKNIFKKISIDLKSIYILHAPRYLKPEFDSSFDDFRFLGDETSIGGSFFSRLKFVSSNHVALGDDTRTGMAQIIYYIRLNDENKFDLCRSDNLLCFQDKKAKMCDPVICKNIEKFELFYVDNKNNKYKYWDSESSEFEYIIPTSVIIKIQIKQRKNIINLETTIKLPIYRKVLK